MNNVLTYERLVEVIECDPVNGLVKRRSQSGKANTDWTKGTLKRKNKNSEYRYYSITVDGFSYKVSRIIWFYVTRTWPLEVSYKDGDSLNNRSDNLKEGGHLEHSFFNGIWNYIRKQDPWIALVLALRISHEYLRKELEYSPDTGLVRWVEESPRRGVRRVGEWTEGIPTSNGLRYRRFGIGSVDFPVSVLAHFYMKGLFPLYDMDHRDRNPSNNKWNNLREATRSQNQMNKEPTGISGSKGVRVIKTKFKGIRYNASVYLPNHKRIDLGTYGTLQEADWAYEFVAKSYHGEFYYKQCSILDQHSITLQQLLQSPSKTIRTMAKDYVSTMLLKTTEPVDILQLVS